MLSAYLVCLLVGGVFVGLSVFAGLGKDADAGKDLGGKDFDKDFGGKDFGGKDFGGKDFDKSFEKDFDTDFDHADADAHLDDLGHEAPLSDAALAGGPREGRRVQRRRFRFRRSRLWLPFGSFRFWTFGACFFGLTGVALTQLAHTGEPTTLLTSLAVGLGSGTATAWLVRRLRAPVGAVAGARGWVGQVGELLYPLAPGETSKVRVRVPGRPPRELLAVLSGSDSRALPRDTRVVILDLADGRAVVEAADPSMLPALPPPQAVTRTQPEDDEMEAL